MGGHATEGCRSCGRVQKLQCDVSRCGARCGEVGWKKQRVWWGRAGSEEGGGGECTHSERHGVRERGKAYICAALPPCVQGNKRVGGAGGGIERRHVPQGARGLVAIITPALRHRRLPWPLAPQSFRSPPRPPANTLTHTAEAGSREGSSGGGGERGGVRRVRYMSGCGKSWPQCF